MKKLLVLVGLCLALLVGCGYRTNLTVDYLNSGYDIVIVHAPLAYTGEQTTRNLKRLYPTNLAICLGENNYYYVILKK